MGGEGVDTDIAPTHTVEAGLDDVRWHESVDISNNSLILLTV